AARRRDLDGSMTRDAGKFLVRCLRLVRYGHLIGLDIELAASFRHVGDIVFSLVLIFTMAFMPGTMPHVETVLRVLTEVIKYVGKRVLILHGAFFRNLKNLVTRLWRESAVGQCPRADNHPCAQCSDDQQLQTSR